MNKLLILMVNDDVDQQTVKQALKSNDVSVQVSEVSQLFLKPLSFFKGAVEFMCHFLWDHQAKDPLQNAQKTQNTQAFLNSQPPSSFKNTLEQQKQQIHSKNLQLLDAAHLKPDFLASMSYQIRTHIHAVAGFSQILAQDQAKVSKLPQTKMLERLSENSNDLQSKLNDLLDVTTFEEKPLTLKCQRFYLDTLIIAILKELQALAAQKGIILEAKTAMVNGAIVNDPQRVKQVLTNLMFNAIEFTEQGYVSIKVQEQGDEEIAIAVQDTGTNLDISQDVFDAFQVSHQAISSHSSRANLELSVSKFLVQAMNGHICAESQRTQGAKFTITLPRTVSTPRVLN